MFFFLLFDKCISETCNMKLDSDFFLTEFKCAYCCMFVYSTLARGIGEAWDLTKYIQPCRIFAPGQSQEPLVFASLVWFFFNLVHLYVNRVECDFHFHELVRNFGKGQDEVLLWIRDFIAVLKTHWLPMAVFCSLVELLSFWHISCSHSHLKSLYILWIIQNSLFYNYLNIDICKL